MNEIAVSHITKRFKSVTALDDVSLRLQEGKIYGLLGRNGAGKSTLLKLIANHIFPDSGSITIDGEANRENDRALHKIYLMSEKSYYPETMRVKNVFKYTREFNPAFDIDRAKHLAGLFELPMNSKVKALSTGYASIFKVVIALSFDLPYIFLDEPILGLDANHRALFYRLLLEWYCEKPRTFVLSTHLIEEVASLIEEVIIVKSGKVLHAQSCESLLESGYTVSGSEAEVDRFIQGKQVIGTDSLGALKVAYVMEPRGATEVPGTLQLSRLDLQKLFVRLTGANAQETLSSNTQKGA